MEFQIRQSLNYENEVSTLFDFLLYFCKIWKISCIKKFEKDEVKKYGIICQFINDIEAIAYDFCKSSLIDAHLKQFDNSILVCSLISISIDMYFRIKLSKA